MAWVLTERTVNGRIVMTNEGAEPSRLVYDPAEDPPFTLHYTALIEGDTWSEVDDALAEIIGTG